MNVDRKGESLDAIAAWIHDGFNGTLITLGQEKSGKTSALFGTQNSGDGLVSYIVDELFNKMRGSQGSSYVLGISIWEILGSQVNDILKTLQTDAHTRDGQFVSIQIDNKEQVLELIQKANKYRFKNGESDQSISSFSHMFIRFCLLNQSCDHLSTLHVVDLASSTSSSTSQWASIHGTNNSGIANGSIINDRIGNFKQIETIRKQTASSLFALNKIIAELGKEEKKVKIHEEGSNEDLVVLSARDSVLTSMVAPLLGGNGRSWLLCCLNSDNAEQAKFTLYSALKGKRYTLYTHYVFGFLM